MSIQYKYSIPLVLAMVTLLYTRAETGSASPIQLVMQVRPGHELNLLKKVEECIDDSAIAKLVIEYT